MTRLNKPFYRAASQIYACLAHQNQSQNPILLPATPWRDLLQLARSVELARDRNWPGAAQRRQRDLFEQLDRVRESLAVLSDQLQRKPRGSSVARPGEMYRDLVALANEFPRVRIEESEFLLCVTTEPIVLEGIDLGPFEICLNWQELRFTPAYRVVALEPNPAASNCDITHPHVNGEQLCEGDGRRAIAAALESGRLSDFFSIVNQLLHTYGEGRAFCELDAWVGVLCHDCGDLIPADEHYCCSGCEHTVCSDYTRSCRTCGEAFCFDCCANCAHCDRSNCSRCLEHCRACGRDVCTNCFTETLCSECYETNQETLEVAELVSETAETQTADPALQSDGLGEAVVPA